MTNLGRKIFSCVYLFLLLKIESKKEDTKSKQDAASVGAPSIDFLNSTVPIDAPKSTIGVRKVQPKRGVCITNILIIFQRNMYFYEF